MTNLTRKMDSLGSNHSIPSMSVSTGSQSSSVNSMQEVIDDMSPDLSLMQSYSCTFDSTSSLVPKKVSKAVQWGMSDVCRLETVVHTQTLDYTVCSGNNTNVLSHKSMIYIRDVKQTKKVQDLRSLIVRHVCMQHTVLNLLRNLALVQ